MSWEFHPARYKEFTKNCHAFMIEATFYAWMPFLTPTLFKISHSEKLSRLLLSRLLLLPYMSASKPVFFFKQQSRDYTIRYPVPGITFYLTQVHHGKLVIQELSPHTPPPPSSKKKYNSNSINKIEATS